MITEVLMNKTLKFLMLYNRNNNETVYHLPKKIAIIILPRELWQRESRS